jgi:peptide/nickel transport system permease protein/oligopeptide transport system permease protein
MQDQVVSNSLAEIGRRTPLGAESGEEELRTRQLSQLQLVWQRFRRHKLAVIGAVVMLVWIVVAIVGPFLMVENPYNALTYSAENQNLAPTLSNWNWILGTDTDGHSILSQIVWGARVSLAVGIFSSIFTTLIGFSIGAFAGFFGRFTDTVMMRVTDVFLTLPFFPVLLIITAFIGQGSVLLIIGIFSFFGWPGVARLARSSYLSLRHQEFVEAARAVGVPNSRIIFKHMMPSALRPVIVVTTLNVSGFIVAEAAIDFLGVGITYPTPSWGNILAGSQDAMGAGNWWWPVFPGLAIVITVLAVNFLGDGLGDALDVRSKL